MCDHSVIVWCDIMVQTVTGMSQICIHDITDLCYIMVSYIVPYLSHYGTGTVVHQIIYDIRYMT